MEKGCVYCEVGTKFLSIIRINFSFSLTNTNFKVQPKCWTCSSAAYSKTVHFLSFYLLDFPTPYLGSNIAAPSAISGFRRDVEIRALLRYYAASNGNHLPTFRDNVSVSSSRSWTYWSFKMGQTSCPETSVKDYLSTLRNTLEERRSTNFTRWTSRHSRYVPISLAMSLTAPINPFTTVLSSAPALKAVPSRTLSVFPQHRLYTTRAACNTINCIKFTSLINKCARI
jgi:hypothetical protein